MSTPSISTVGKEILSSAFRSGDPEEIYTKWAATYDSDCFGAFGLASPDWTAVVAAKELKEYQGETGKLQLLDMGCGTGAVSSILREKHDFGKNGTNTEGAEIDGSDLTQAMLDVAANRPGLYRNLEKCDMSQTPWPFQSSNYDMVLCNGVLVYIKDNVMDAMKEFHRVLKVGGKAVLMIREDDVYRWQPALTFLADSGAWKLTDETDPLDGFLNMSDFNEGGKDGKVWFRIKVFTKLKEL